MKREMCSVILEFSSRASRWRSHALRASTAGSRAYSYRQAAAWDALRVGMSGRIPACGNPPVCGHKNPQKPALRVRVRVREWQKSAGFSAGIRRIPALKRPYTRKYPRFLMVIFPDLFAIYLGEIVQNYSGESQISYFVNYDGPQMSSHLDDQ